MRDYKSLPAFILADQLAVRIHEGTLDFPEGETILRDRVRNGAAMVASEIVHSCSAGRRGSFECGLEVALESAYEVRYNLSLLTRIGFFPTSNQATVKHEEIQEGYDKLIGQLRELTKGSD